MAVRVLASAAALVVLSACAGLTPAGRNSEPAEAPRVAAPPSPAPAQIGTPLRSQAPVASDVRLEPPPPPPRPPGDEDEIVVQGQQERQVPPPEGDPRSTLERRQDIRAWDQCVTRAQAIFDTDPMRAQLETPEELCARSLGMANRNAVPISRRD